MTTKILVIKHGAFGDFILSLGPFQTIRKAWPEAHVTLLTTKPYVELARKTDLFDEVWVDEKPKIWQPKKINALRRKLVNAGFDWVYDLQTSDRTGFYYKLLRLSGCRFKWSGVAMGCSHPDKNPKRKTIHTLERQKEQLRVAGLQDYQPADLTFLSGDIGVFSLKEPFVLLVPGCAPHRPQKKWPYYDELAKSLIKHGFKCVGLGGPGEKELIEKIEQSLSKEQKKSFYNLAGKTTFEHLAELARQAKGAVGNDTGPMHLIAASGCPSIVLFSSDSDPDKCRPRGAWCRFLQENSLHTLPVDRVESYFNELLDHVKKGTDKS